MGFIDLSPIPSHGNCSKGRKTLLSDCWVAQFSSPSRRSRHVVGSPEEVVGAPFSWVTSHTRDETKEGRKEGRKKGEGGSEPGETSALLLYNARLSYTWN